MVVRKKMAAPEAAPPPPLLRVLALGLFLLVLSPGRSQAQQAPSPAPAASDAVTDPLEARSLNTMFARWRLSPPRGTWNVTGDPCSGTAVDDATSFNAVGLNPSLKCVCDVSICHITQLKVYDLDVLGPIPDELRNLKRLFDLNLMQNYLTGPIPAFIGNLTDMKWLSLALNGLSGPVPHELGNLKSLITLGMGGNNFNGTLPRELGNLANLEELYVDSSGLGGDIPPSLSNLKKLRVLWAFDNNFTGRIPDFIGAWTNLTRLRIHGNSFEGPIPSNIASLTKLSDLRIGEIVNGSSSLDFVQNLTSLTTLVLRNCKISGTIPSSFRQFTSLQMLDLSFNNITGQLPSFLFNLTSLAHLFLGNNSLTGSLPLQKSSSLLNIDLSYNELSGSFPSWVTDKNLQLNLVFNNFVITDSNSSDLPSGLKCLQRDIPCNRFSPIYSSFGINCGGQTVKATNNAFTYEADESNLTAASFHVEDTQKWAASNIGWFIDASNPDYRWSIINVFTNTLDFELYKTARLSPSSLRYYGLGLQNGNYTIKLHFGETAFPDTPLNWKTGGRRLFDIYIQGRLREQNFDIRRRANGSYIALVTEFVAPVTENFLEIHLFWAGRGTCCTPTPGYYGPAISAISVSPFDFTPNVTNQPRTSSPTNKKSTGPVIGATIGVATFCILLFLGILLWRLKRKRSSWDDDEELAGLSLRADTFSYAELKAATEEFNPRNKLGEGGFGPVFKGTLSDGRVVAVKQLLVASRQGKRQFVTEIDTISAVQQRNLVKLYGCCVEGNNPLLVYEFLENGSLDQALFGEKKLRLDWPTRFEICLGTARGLAYLHEESRLRIVHRDVKSSNILLDSDLKPKISDFGLAKLYDDKKTHISTRVAGTIGYLAPEYAMRGHLTEKADVFGFGVVALEIISGRHNSNADLPPEQIYLLEWAWHLHETKCELGMVDPELKEYDAEEVLRVIGVSLLCTQAAPLLRPSMSRVVAMLVGDMEVSEVTAKPAYLTDWQFNDVTNSYESADSIAEPTAAPTTAGSHVDAVSTTASDGASLWPSPMVARQASRSVGEGR